jgi:L-fuconolactonase
MGVIRRDFGPRDLLEEIRAAGIDGVVSVQARQSVAETEWLLELAGNNDFIKGVVGWVPLILENVTADLERYAAHAKLRGVRHVVHDEADDFFILREDFNRGVSELKRFGLAYDVLIFEKHLPQTIEFLDRHPDQVFVIDHIAKPLIKEGMLEPWSRLMHEVAKRENVFCKLSGMVTEADWKAWTPESLAPYAETVLEAFGPSRVMFGTDWPVCLLASGYQRWVDTVRGFAGQLSEFEQAQIFGGTAVRAYGLV